MPQAGFWSISPTRKIHFGKDGWWYANDERIQHRRINKLFSQCLRKNARGEYEIVLGYDRARVEIEDTPYVVTRVTGDSERGFRLRLNDESEERLSPHTLAIGANDVLYCKVKGGQHAARFLRPAYYQLTQHVRPAATGEGFVLPIGATTYPIQVPEPD